MTFEEELKLRTEEADEIIKYYLPQEEGLHKTLLQAVNYGVSSGGKRLRPILMNETFKLFDGKSRVIEPFMAGIEYIHASSLIHDDLPCMDNDEYRRGKKSTWAVYGEAMGTLAGDALLMYALETAAKGLSENTSSPANVAQAMGVLAQKAGISGMIGGQSVDVELTGKELTGDVLRFIYELKTGALLEAAMMCGAILADASAEDVQTCEKIARLVGLAFQIRDDILDVTSTQEALGRPVGSDEKNQKTTFVSLYGLERAEQAVEAFSNEAITKLHQLTGENRFLESLLLSLIKREK